MASICIDERYNMKWIDEYARNVLADAVASSDAGIQDMARGCAERLWLKHSKSHSILIAALRIILILIPICMLLIIVAVAQRNAGIAFFVGFLCYEGWFQIPRDEIIGVILFRLLARKEKAQTV